MKEPLVHVLVINWNGLEHLRECFDSLLAGSYANVRFVLIDNASMDGSVEFVRDNYGVDPRVDIIECPENLGWSRGNNVGIEKALEAGADYVLLLNNDTASAPDAIAKLVETAEQRPEVGALAPKMLLYDNPDIINSVGIECSIIGSSWDLGLGRLDGPRWNAPRKVLGVCGGAAFYRAEALRTAGLLPTDFDIYLDDLDLCLRIWNAGYEVWSCPKAVVRHKFSATMGRRDGGGKQYRRKYYLNTRNRGRVILRNFPVSKFPLIKATYAVGEVRAVGRALLDRAPWRALAHVRSWGSVAAYVPRAIAERIRRRRAGQGTCRFWPLIRTDCMFFAGVDLPVDGWYPARQVQGRTVRPMSRRAHCNVNAGTLRLTHANCYPHIGEAYVEVCLDGQPIVELRTRGVEETVLETSGGRLELTSMRIFEAEETGEKIDVGGWIGLEPDPLRPGDASGNGA